MEQHVIGQNLEENKAVLERLFWYMVGIVNLVHQQHQLDSDRRIACQEIGTGAACQFRRVKLILTAKHVLDGAQSSDLRFFPHATGRIEWADEPKRTRVERCSLDIERIVCCEWEDLAAIVLTPSGAKPEYMYFCELPDKFGAPPENGTCVVVGHPSDQAVVAEISRQRDHIVHNLTTRSDGFCGEVVTTDKPLSEFDPEAHFLLSFQPSVPGGRPDGYSGAGVWFQRKSDANGVVWTADPRLVGIQTHVYRNLGLLRIVRSNTVREFLEEAFPSTTE